MLNSLWVVWFLFLWHSSVVPKVIVIMFLPDLLPEEILLVEINKLYEVKKGPLANKLNSVSPNCQKNDWVMVYRSHKRIPS